MNTAAEYVINPTLMMGTVREIQDELVTIHLRGRLGVIRIAKKHFKGSQNLAVDTKVRFFFSYIHVVETVYEFDNAIVNQAYDLSPSLLHGEITDVNDTSVQVEMAGNLGTVIVPRRWVFTNQALEKEQQVSFYFSYMEVID